MRSSLRAPLAVAGASAGGDAAGQDLAVVFVVGLIVALAPIVPWPASAVVAASALAALAWSFAVDIRRLYHGRALEE